MKLERKKQIVEELNREFARIKVLIATDYKGLDVSAITDLRRKLRESGTTYRVVKNTLLIRAAEETDAALIGDLFKGPSAVAYNLEDPVAPAKSLMDFIEDNSALEIKGGVLDGNVLEPDAIKALSKLPSREVLLGRVLSVMTAVPARFVRVLNGVPQQFLNVLVAIKDQKETT